MENEKKPVVKKTWEKFGTHCTLNGDGFYISYRNVESAHVWFEETAIVVRGKTLWTNTYFILKGDWREDYEGIIDQGLEACKEFFRKNNLGRNSSGYSSKI